ncbi:GH18861 [Drosophila grimshawi]|uniref:GH18861 n=1 Tax=Drosophila grimshawi TaxID=7222 RepID=B4JS47_DROGR|nr:GH18861 [Drosophila grimshawi]
MSQKGRIILQHDGFFYVREKRINKKTYWRCCLYTTARKCHGRIHSLNGQIVQTSKHNHSSDENGRIRRRSLNASWNCMLFASFTSTRKKKRKLLIDEHEFVMDRKLKSSINWRCARYRSANCKVRATTHQLKKLVRKQGIMIVKGTKGKPKLLMAGFEYFRNNSRGTKTYWLCARNRYLRCAARIITCSSTGELVVKNQQHNHGPQITMQPSRKQSPELGTSISSQ